MFLKNLKTFHACIKQQMLDERCFAMWPNGQAFCLISKLQMFDEQCLIIMTEPYTETVPNGFFPKKVMTGFYTSMHGSVPFWVRYRFFDPFPIRFRVNAMKSYPRCTDLLDSYLFLSYKRGLKPWPNICNIATSIAPCYSWTLNESSIIFKHDVGLLEVAKCYQHVSQHEC